MRFMLQIGVGMIIENRLLRLDLTQLINLKDFKKNDSLIDASNDLQAVYKWLARFNNEHTIRSYSRDATRFLLWLSFIKGKHLNELLLDDLQEYIKFLESPSDDWCMDKKKLKRYDHRWRPFSKPLSKTSIAAAIAALQSLFSFLEAANYINKNPVKLLKTQNIIGSIQAQKYNVFARMLENDEWVAVQQVLQELPIDTIEAKKYKARANLLFCLLYLLGLRIEEASSLVWSNFKKVDGRWWCFIIGKGDKLGHIPVNEAMLDAIHNYRALYNVTSNLEKDDNFVFLNEKGENLTSRTLYNCVKDIGRQASYKFKDKIKQEKLCALSPHWLRHLSASHQDKRGVPATMIRDNHRHSSINTTQIYMHAEDVARHEIMQEHIINIESVKIEHKVQYYLSIKLTKGPLDKEHALSLIKKSIETSILANAKLIEDGDTFLKYKLLESASNSILDNIKMLCKVWLFEPIIEQGAICQN
jgi:site-specific recombinase XerD